MKTLETAGSYKIRPAGRHIFTIGRDLIKDRYAAIVELVKNAYDADAHNVDIIFKASDGMNRYSITVKDDGCGMTRETVINYWMVPSTDNKLKKKQSKEHRIMQGNKGIGRFAASILGEDLLLETVTGDGEKTTAYMIWSSFENAMYLDDVEILIESAIEKNLIETVVHGTTLTINGNSNSFGQWNQDNINRLKSELKKLISPIYFILPDGNEDIFNIYVRIENFFKDQAGSIDEIIKPFPVFSLFDYRIAGTINSDGRGELIYSMQKIRNAHDETISFDLGSSTDCGKLYFDIRVYDREKESIESLIKRGLKDERGEYLGQQETRRLLNEINGISVYRNGFRIRPMGDPGFDWLKLGERRVQNPTMRVGYNQVTGYVLIESEESSGLIEKSARDGLVENLAFEKLKNISAEVISKLETKRYKYRKDAGLGGRGAKISNELKDFFEFEKIKTDIKKRLVKEGVSEKVSDDIIDIVKKEEEKKKLIAEDVLNSVAIYQGQATLGKIINVVLHEGRRPLNYFKNQIPNLKYWLKSFNETNEKSGLLKFITVADEIGNQADIFVKLFSRLDPLAAGKRGPSEKVFLKKTIENIFLIFDTGIREYGISVSVAGLDNFSFKCWQQDIYSIFTNLIDNSIYWMTKKNAKKKEISVILRTEGDSFQYIDYRDTGPGIEPELIASGIIFDPEFSTKPGGMGLGLPIAGEAASRSGFDLQALESENGAYFRLLLKEAEQ